MNKEIQYGYDKTKTSYVSDSTKRKNNYKNNWNELKEFVEKDVKRWEQEEQKWIELGFMKFGGEANNKIIFKKVLSKMQEIESRK